jgi:hypothetical protein
MAIAILIICALTLALAIGVVLALSVSPREHWLFRNRHDHEKCSLFEELERTASALELSRKETEIVKGQLSDMVQKYLDATKEERAGEVSCHWRGTSSAKDPKDREIGELRAELADTRRMLNEMKRERANG